MVVAAVHPSRPLLTLSERLSVWLLTSFLVAIALGFAVEWFLPQTKASIPGLSGLPVITQNVVFVLVLVMAGVLLQASWWVVRRR